MNSKSQPHPGASRKVIQILTGAYDLAETQFSSLFPSRRQGPPNVLEVLGLAALYGLGLFMWRYFLNGGSIPFELHDWAQVTAPRFAFLKDAITRGALPLHMPGSWALNIETDRYISIVDANLSPQTIMLRWMEIGEFILANALILYTLGFVGLLLLRRKLSLSFISVAILFWLLFFNGHITSHVAVGHANWLTYLLLPYLAYLILWLFDNPPRWPWIAFFAVWMLVVALNGAFHLYVGTLLFMVLLLMSYGAQRRTVLLGIIFSLVVGMVRLLPPILEIAKFDTEFLSGYTTVAELIASFVWLREPTSSQAFASSLINPLGWWEKDFYLGVVGFAFVIVFGPVAWIRRHPSVRAYLPLLFPIGVLLILSIGRVYGLVGHLNIPLLNSQRVATRLIALPVTFTVVLSVLAFEAMLRDKSDRITRLLTIAGLILLTHDLWQHFRLWRVAHMPGLFPPRPLDLSLNVVANHPDPPYTIALGMGALLTLISLVLVIALALRKPEHSSGLHPRVG